MKIKIATQPLENWWPQIERPLIISGPCSAESAEQVMATARQLAATGKVDIFRAGVWKPRTRPNNFEGIGVEALKWLQQVKAETGLLTAVEVANKHHVEAALAHGIDLLWVGARTTVNPFSVQEVADALRGTDVPVMVKNPVNPDLDLWIGGLERIHQAGITKLAAIHRGFSPLSHSPYRNDPNWNIPMELKRLLPDLPIVCDPSHIAGKADKVEAISQKAMDLQMEGLMIESHIDPPNALSDAKQQITPAALADMLGRLEVRAENSSNIDFQISLASLREQIDRFDEELMRVLSARMKVATQIADFKRENKVTVFQHNRYEEMMQERMQKASSLELDASFIHDMYELIHHHSVKLQTELINRKPAGV